MLPRRMVNVSTRGSSFPVQELKLSQLYLNQEGKCNARQAYLLLRRDQYPEQHASHQGHAGTKEEGSWGAEP